MGEVRQLYICSHVGGIGNTCIACFVITLGEIKPVMTFIFGKRAIKIL